MHQWLNVRRSQPTAQGVAEYRTAKDPDRLRRKVWHSPAPRLRISPTISPWARLHEPLGDDAKIEESCFETRCGWEYENISLTATLNAQTATHSSFTRARLSNARRKGVMTEILSVHLPGPLFVSQ